jgi:hypothetical protein
MPNFCSYVVYNRNNLICVIASRNYKINALNIVWKRVKKFRMCYESTKSDLCYIFTHEKSIMRLTEHTQPVARTFSSDARKRGETYL